MLTKILEVDSDLMHPPGERSAENHTGRPIEAHPLELRPALLAVTGDLADPDLVADHLHRLAALRLAPGHSNKNKASRGGMSGISG